MGWLEEQAERERQKAVQRAALGQQKTEYERLRNEHKTYLDNAQSALGALDKAAGGVEFMSGTQLQSVQEDVENAIYPESNLFDKLDFKKNLDGSITYSSAVSSAVDALNTQITILQEKYDEYVLKISVINQQLMSL